MFPFAPLVVPSLLCPISEEGKVETTGLAPILLMRICAGCHRYSTRLRELRLAIESEHQQKRLLFCRLNASGLPGTLRASAAAHECDVLFSVNHEGDRRTNAGTEPGCLVFKELLAFVGGVRNQVSGGDDLKHQIAGRAQRASVTAVADRHAPADFLFHGIIGDERARVPAWKRFRTGRRPAGLPPGLSSSVNFWSISWGSTVPAPRTRVK